MNSPNLLSLVVLTALFSLQSFADDKPETFDCPLAMSTLETTYGNVDPKGYVIKNGTGRAQINADVNFSYYMQSQGDPSAEGFPINAPMVMIPMSSSRLSPGWVSSPEWWNANLEKINAAKAAGEPMPYEDREEVKDWLDKNKLSTNPDVFFITDGTVDHKSLQEFLLDFMRKNADQDEENYFLYRGAVRAEERGEWLSKNRPRGARYWTPSADYAWRYGRKQSDFLHALIKDEAPVLKFKIPKKEYEWLVKKTYLVVGTELTKHVHDTFDQEGIFMDQLMGGPYVGSGEFAPEIEIRASRKSATQFIDYFAGSVTIGEMVTARVKVIKLAIERVKKQYTAEIANPLINHLNERIVRAEAEGKLLQAIHDKRPVSEVEQLYQALPNGEIEIVNNDADSLDGLVQEYRDGKI